MKKYKGLITVIGLLVSINSWAQYPKDFSLEDLDKQINKQEECSNLPCSSLNAITLNSSDKGLVLTFSIDARIDSIQTLPINLNDINLKEVLLNNKPWSAIEVKDGKLSVVGLKGKNELSLIFTLKGQSMEISEYEKSFVNLSKDSRIHVENKENSYLVSMSKSSSVGSDNLSVSKYQSLPLFEVFRVLKMEDKWTLHTTVKPLTSDSNLVSQNMEIDAFPGETTLSNDIHIENGKIKLSLSSQGLEWDSVVEPSNELKINGNKDYLNKLQVLNTTNWLVSSSSLAPIARATNNQYASSDEWLFWANDKLDLNVLKPVAIKGETLALQSSHLLMDTSNNQYTYEYTIKSSLGDKIQLTIAPQLKLKKLFINEQDTPFSINKDLVSVAINAGVSNIKLILDTQESLSFWYQAPQIKLNVSGTNYSQDLVTPQDRWVLWTGGSNIHASILLWGILICCVIFAYPLSKGVGPLSWVAWSLLLMGMSQSSEGGIYTMIIWFMLLKYKEKKGVDISKRWIFNIYQIFLVFMTISVVGNVVETIANGLLNYPHLFLEGSQTTPDNIHWYSEQLSQFNPWMISLPMWTYRTLMFLWSLWFAFNVMNWLKWAWEAFSTGGLWRSKIKISEGSNVMKKEISE